MAPSLLTSYTERFSYRPGDSLALYVSVPAPAEVDLSLVKLKRALGTPETDMSHTPIDWLGAGRYTAEPQESCVGSFVVDSIGATQAHEGHWGAGALVWIAAHGDDTQTIIWAADDSTEARLLLDRGVPALLVGNPDRLHRLAVDRVLRTHVWYWIGCTVSRSGDASVIVMPCDAMHDRPQHSSADFGPVLLPQEGQVCIGAARPAQVEAVGGVVRGRATDHFTGKIEAPSLFCAEVSPDIAARLAGGATAATVFGSDLVASWSFAPRTGGDPNSVLRQGPTRADALVVNLPGRGVTGHNWSGRKTSFTDAPDEYAAIHFHATDVADAGWSPLAAASLPADLPSGVYAIAINDGSTTDTVPFVVLPQADAERAAVTVLLPTFTYLAYANEALFEGMDVEKFTDKIFPLAPGDEAHIGDRSFGRSLYDTHPDGSGVMFSSSVRPIVNMRPDYSWWQSGAGRGFGGDTYLLEWLERLGVEYDVVTDLELHQHGRTALGDTKVVITGAHPEYHSESMLAALKAYRDGGGALMYLGGNGFYWVTGVYSEDPLVVEVRRGVSGVRAWNSYPGEVTLISSGEPGGLWRNRGRAPQSLVGVGFAAMGWGQSQPYYLCRAASDRTVSWIFDGVHEDPIGDYGRVMNGASGDEVDRIDYALGTVTDAIVLASSRDHTNYYQRAIEEVLFIADGQHGGHADPDVHADMVYFTTPGGGQVFSVGSIAWSGALLENDCDNGVSTITENVLRRFAHLPERT